jgi:hypothetical protein
VLAVKAVAGTHAETLVDPTRSRNNRAMRVQVNDVRLFFDVEGAKLIPDGPIMRETYQCCGLRHDERTEVRCRSMS